MSFSEQIIENVPAMFICLVIVLCVCFGLAVIAWAWSLAMMALELGIKYLQGFQVGVLGMLTRWHDYRRSERDAERNHLRKEYWENQPKDSWRNSDFIDEE